MYYVGQASRAFISRQEIMMSSVNRVVTTRSCKRSCTSNQWRRMMLLYRYRRDHLAGVTTWNHTHTQQSLLRVQLQEVAASSRRRRLITNWRLHVVAWLCILFQNRCVRVIITTVCTVVRKRPIVGEQGENGKIFKICLL